ncbi:MAG: DNA polymerase domain-containing protein [Candidatus Thorarchaeota archaeon]
MSDNRLWLLETSYNEEERAIRQTYLQTPAQTIKEFHADFIPYFFALPTSLGEKVQRKDLMKNKNITVAKVSLPTTKKVDREWERDLKPAMSYVYDQDQRFGCPHKITDDEIRLDQKVPKEQLEKFHSQFASTATQDPLKYEFLKEFFRYTVQPVPSIPRDLLNIDSKYDESRLLWGIMLARIANIPFLRALTSRSVSEWIRSMLHSSYRRLGILIPDAEELKKGHKPHRVEGALTIAPTPGAYYHMTVLDFESLYPSLIDRYNLSYETMDCDHSNCCSNKVPDEQHYVCIHQRGIFSALIGALKDLRINWYKPQIRQTNLASDERRRAKTISDLLKFLLVSSGGVTIRIQGLASPPLAESMMAYGRWALRTSWDFAVEKGMRPVYGDTDSLFLDNPSKQQIEWLIAKVKDELGLQLAVDVTYPLCVFSSAKKAYFGILPDGNPDVKGITLGKSSTPPRFQHIFFETVKPLGAVDTPKKLAQAAPRIIEILQHEIARLRNREFTVEEMEYRVKVWKADKERTKNKALAQPYQALQQLADKGIKVKKRDEVRFVKVKPFRYGSRVFTVKPTTLASKMEIDIPDYIRKLEMAFQQVLGPLGLPFPREQSKALDAFLSSISHEPFLEPITDSEVPRKKKSNAQKRLEDFSNE